MSRSQPDTAEHADERDVNGLSELAYRLVAAAPLKHPRLHRVVVIVLTLLLVICLVSTITRLSPLPLIPLPPLALAAYAARRLRTAPDSRRLLGWTTVLVLSTVVCFWLIAVAGRILD